MLLKLVLIDDNFSTLEYLQNLIPWNSLGFEVTGAFSDSKKAIESPEITKADIIITDISMPDVNGMQIVEFLSVNAPDTKIILLSAYRDFSYAQAAIHYRNVIDYLTKPLDYNKLEATLHNAANMINKNAFTSVSDEFLRQQIFSNLLCGFIESAEELKAQLSTLGLNISCEDSPCTIISTTMDNFSNILDSKLKHEPIRIYHAISNMIEFENDKRYVSIAMYSSNVIVWIMIHKNDLCEQNIADFTEDILTNSRSLLGTATAITYTQTYRNISEIISRNVLDEIHVTEKRASKDDVINKILDTMNTHYGENISLSVIAQQVYMSPVYLSRYFKNKTGKKFIDVLTEIRMKNAERLLRESDMSISEIANHVGYDHIGNFYERFKKYYNMTPFDYKKNLNSEV